MKKLLFFAILIFAATTAQISMAEQTVLWIPYHSSAINEGLKILESNENLKLTIALDKVSPSLEKRIKALEEKGQLEVALRLPNDPVIPLLYYPGSGLVSWEKKPAKSALPDNAPYFMGLRIGMAMDNARKNLKRRPAGLVLPPGSLIKDYFPLAKGIGIKWLASGPFYYEGDENNSVDAYPETADMPSTETKSDDASQNGTFTDGAYGYEDTGNEENNNAAAAEDAYNAEPEEALIAEVSGVKVLPFVPYSDNAAAKDEPFIVFDETAEENPGPLRASFKEYLFSKMPDSENEIQTITAIEASENYIAAETDPEEIENIAQPWTGDYSRWANKSSQLGALVAMSQTRSELMKHLNSKAGNMQEAMPAFSAYYEAENGRKFLNLGSEDSETAKSSETEMRSSITNIFAIMDKKPPQWTLSSLSDAGTGRNTAIMRVAMKKTGFEIKNDQKPPVFDQMPSNLPDTVDPYKIWKLNSFKTELVNNSIIFRFIPAAINNSGSNLSGFSHIAIDLYIDVNHRINTGSASMLPGRPMKMSAEDCWEYALEITPSAAYLYRSTSQGPKQIGKYRPRAQAGAITVSVPSSVLRGTPRAWGYAALMLIPLDGNKYAAADTLSSSIYANTIYAVRPGEGD